MAIFVRISITSKRQLDLCSYLRKENRCAMPNSDFSCGRNTFFFGSRHCAAVLFSQVPKKCTDLDLSLLYILTLGTYSKVTRKNIFPAPGVCFPQPCSSDGRRFAASRSRSQNYRRMVSVPQCPYSWAVHLDSTRLNKKAANLQKILSSFGVLWN